MSVEKLPIARAINLGIRDAMRADDKVMLMGEDVARLGGVFRVTGPQVERMVVQTDWENEEAIAFLQHRLKRLGVEAALERAGAVDGDEIRIVGRAFEFESARTSEDAFRELDL